MTEVRRATLADLERIAELEVVCVGADAWSEALIGQGLADELPTVAYFVALVDGETAGYAVASYVDDVAELQRIGVDPLARRGGVASALVDAVVACATEAARILLEVREDNEGGRAFYERLGFTELDRRPRYYRDGEAAIVLAKDINR